MANLLDRCIQFRLAEEALELNEAIKYSQIIADEAQEKVNKYTRLLNQANEQKRKALSDGKELIEKALAKQQTELEVAQANHQAKLAELNTSFQQQQEWLENRIEQLAKTKSAKAAAVQNEFENFVDDTNSRKQIGTREIARIQSLLAGTEEDS